MENSLRYDEHGMRKGILIFAHNNQFNYLRMADLAAGFAKRNLGLPVTIATDMKSMRETDVKHADDIVFLDLLESNTRTFKLPTENITVNWYNHSRRQAYDISPYEQTLLIDSDLLLCSDRLAHLFDTEHDFAYFDTSYDVMDLGSLDRDRLIGKYSLSMVWATALYWRRSEFARSVFDMADHVRQNYRYYSLLFNFKSTPYRNDFAFTIALHLLNGYGVDSRRVIPWRLAALSSDAEVLEFRPGNAEFVVKQNQTVSRLSEQDLHIMNKRVFEDERLVARFQEYISA